MTAPISRNTAPAHDPRRSTHFLWEEFDALPKVMRDLMNYSPVSVGTGYVFRQLQGGVPLRHVLRQAYARWRRYARHDALRHWGPTHPQVEGDSAA